MRSVRQAYETLEYDSVVERARRAIAQERLSRAELVLTYELLGYAYGALGETGRAVEAFRELIRLDPDREPDVNRVAPRISSLYFSALGQVTVIRRVQADPASFVAGAGGFPIQFQVSRPARVTARVVGPGLEASIESLAVSGEGVVTWRALGPGGAPAAPGRYQIVLQAVSGRETFETLVTADVAHGRVDTLPHVTRLEGYEQLPEYERPPRSWTPLTTSVLYAAGSVAALTALQPARERTSLRGSMLAVGAATVASGLLVSFRRPEPRPVQRNILFNRLLREQIARQNDEIARANAQRRTQTLISITPAPRRT